MKKQKVKPIIFGGEQQKNMRSGTENVPGIAGIGLAAKTIYTDLDEKGGTYACLETALYRRGTENRSYCDPRTL